MGLKNNGDKSAIWPKKNKKQMGNVSGGSYLCWRKLSGRLKCLPHTSHEKAISGLLWVRSWIIKLYDLVNRRWQYLHTYSHFGRILRRKSSLSIFNTVNILELLFFVMCVCVFVCYLSCVRERFDDVDSFLFVSVTSCVEKCCVFFACGHKTQIWFGMKLVKLN